MKKFLPVLLLLFYIPVSAQKSCIYEFKNTLHETSDNGPVLTPLGKPGVFVLEALPELGGIRHMVYKFEKNCGLNYNMRKSVLNLTGNYSIEIYFKFDALESWKRVIDFKNRDSDNGAYIFNGKLNFYNIVTSDIAPVAAGEYTHYTFTYDAGSKMVNIYADGIGKISFYDRANDASIDPNELHFFYDDLKVNNEASSGTVAYIKFFDYVVSPEEAKKNFNEMDKTINGEVIKTPPVVVTEAKAKLAISVVNANDLTPLTANIVITNKNTGAFIDSIRSDGSSEIELPKGLYKLNVKAKQFARTIEEVSIEVTTGTINKEIKLTPVKIGEQVKLENVHFKQGVAVLLPESYPVLDKLVKMLSDNAGMEIELSGHTDNAGDPKLNLKLSEERVVVIKNYLISKGVNAQRINGKGYGGTMPIAPNDKEENRKQNRRVDFKVTKF